jgi:hypothetical protein
MNPLQQIEVINEVEVETKWVRQANARQRGRSAPFIRGPIPLDALGAAARLSLQAGWLLLLIHHQMALSGRRVVTLPNRLLAKFGMNRWAKARGIKQLEAAGFIQVERAKGCLDRIRLVRAGKLNQCD